VSKVPRESAKAIKADELSAEQGTVPSGNFSLDCSFTETQIARLSLENAGLPVILLFSASTFELSSTLLH
jgi:hypothetical protein